MKKSAMAVLVFMVVFVSHLVFAGDIDSPGPPSEGSKMPSLLNIYDYLNLGTLWTDPGSFQEPAAGPGSTMKTTKEIYDDSKTKFDQCDAEASDVATDKKFFSTQPGNWGVKTGTGLISNGDAVEADVLAPKTFSKLGSAGLTGTMTDREGDNASTAQAQALGVNYFTSPQGYYDGDDRVSATDAQVAGLAAGISSGNIRSTVTIFGVAGKTEVVDTTTASPVAAARMKNDDVGFVNGNKITGTGTKELSAASENVAEGYYAATTLSAVDADLAAANIVTGKTIFGKAGSAVAATGNAVEADVLAPKTFSNSDSAGLTGTMTNVGQQTITPTTTNQAITQGYHAGTGYAQGDADLVSANIRAGQNIFGVAGDPNVVDTSTGDAVAGEILNGKKAWVGGSEITGTATAGNNVNGAEGLKTFSIPNGLYSGSKTATANDADLTAPNIKDGVVIFGVTGTFPSDGTAVAGEVKTGSTFYTTSGTTLTGNGTKTLDAASDTVNAGYYEATTLSAVDADLAVANIVTGKTIFGKAGTAVAATGDAVVADVLATKTFSNSSSAGLTGTMTNVGQQIITPTTTNQAITQGYHAGTGYAQGDADLVAGNIKSGIDIFGVMGELHGGCDCSGGTPNGDRWCDNGDGTVTDLTTCLVWLKDASWGSTYAFWVNTMNGTNAHDRAAQLKNGVGGLTDSSVEGNWRLPTKTELYNLANEPEAVRSGNMRAFTGAQSHYYWSSTTYGSHTDLAWSVGMSNGYVYLDVKDYDHYVWPVRSGNLPQ